MNKITRDQIVKAVKEWEGTPFHHQARLKDVGVDCAGVVECIAKELSQIPREYKAVLDYAREPDEQMKKYLNANLKKRSKTQRLPGTILFFGFAKRTQGQHLGILIDNRRFIHAYSKVGRVVKGELNEYWLKKLIAAYDFKGIK